MKTAKQPAPTPSHLVVILTHKRQPLRESPHQAKAAYRAAMEDLIA